MEFTNTFETNGNAENDVYTKNGLTVKFDEENSEIIFDWDSEKNPEWDFLLATDKNELINRMFEQIGIDLRNVEGLEIKTIEETQDGN